MYLYALVNKTYGRSLQKICKIGIQRIINSIKH